MAQRSNQTINYIDTGCKKAKREGYEGPCVDCPFIKCFDDHDFDWERYQREKRNTIIRDLWHSGTSINQLKKQFHLDFYTVKKICNVT